MNPRRGYTVSISLNGSGEAKYYFDGRGKDKMNSEEEETVNRLRPHMEDIISETRNGENYSHSRLNIKVRHRK